MKQIQKIDQTLSPYYKRYMTKQEKYVIRKEVRRLKRAKDFQQAELVYEQLDKIRGTKRTLNQRQIRKIARQQPHGKKAA